MAGIGGMLGTAGGAAGTGFSGPDNASIRDPITGEMLNTANTGTNTALNQQNNLLGALQGQNGLANQSAVFNQLSNVANGTGPNPAQAQLAQATSANTANQAALMAGQRGSAANTGLIARQAAMQGAANQQNSAGQAATLQANQSLNALNSMGSLANTQVANQIGQTNANVASRQAQQSNLLNANAGINSANVANQSNINNINGQLANTQLQGQQAMIGGMMNGIGSVMGGGMGGAEGGEVPEQTAQQPAPAQAEVAPTPVEAPAPIQDPQANFGNFSTGTQAAQTQAAATPSFGGDSGAAALAQGMAAPGKAIGGMGQQMMSGMGMMGGGSGGGSGGGGGGMGSMAMLAMLAEGGPIRMAEGGPSSIFGQYIAGVQAGQTQAAATPSFGSNSAAAGLQQGMDTATKAAGKQMKGNQTTSTATDTTHTATRAGTQFATPEPFAQGGKVPALLSPGEKYLSPQKVMAVQKGADPMAIGSTVPGKPKVGGAKNSYANDTVPATLEEGGIVLPRSVTQAKNPQWAAHKFVSDILAKQGKLPPRKPKAPKGK